MTTIGKTIGAAIGKGAAYGAHGAICAAQGTGRFGQDLVAGVSEGYTTKAAELAKLRAALSAAHSGKPIAIKVSKSAREVAA